MKRHPLAVVLALVVTLLCATGLWAQPTPSVSTDQPDYPPGATVNISGSGFQAGEPVQLQVLRIDIDENSGPEHEPWQVTTEANGSFTATWLVTPDEAGATLQLTARGLTSGAVAQTTFTDSPIAQRGSAATASTSGTSLTISKPAGVVQGDVLIANLALTATTGPTAPSGWTLIDGRVLSSGSRFGALFYKVAGPSEGSSYTFTVSGNSTVGTIVAFSGVDTSGGPFDVTPGTLSTANSSAASATSITAVSPNAAVILFAMTVDSDRTFSGWTTTSPGTLAELYDNQNTANNGASVGAAWARKTTPGATGSGTVTLSGSTRNGAILLALKPLASPSHSTLSPVTATKIADGSSTQMLTVQTRDGNNNNLTTGGETVVFSATAGSLSATTDNGDGTYTATWTSPTSVGAGTATVTATMAGAAVGTAVGASACVITLQAGPASKLGFTTQPANTTAGATMANVVVQVQDANGNAVAQSGTAITLTLNGSDLYSGTNPQYTDASGKATFNNLVIRQAGTGLTFAAAGSSLATATSSSFNVTAAAASSVSVETAANGSGSVVSPQSLTSGSSITVYAITRDPYGNFVGNPSSTWSLSSSTGGVVAGDLAPASGTSSTFTAHLVGSAAIHVANGSLNANSGTLTVLPGALAKYAVSAAPATRGTAFNVTVTAQDANNNTVTGDSSTLITLTGSTANVLFDGAGDGSFADNTVVLTNGICAISTKDNFAETITITATDANSKTGNTSLTLSAATGDFRSRANGNWDATTTWSSWNGTAWVNATTVPAGSVGIGVTIQSGNTVTLRTQSSPLNLSGLLNAVGTLTINPGVTLNVNSGGIIQNSGAINQNGSLVFNSGASYQHNFTTSDGALPASTWNAGSTCVMMGYTSFSANPTWTGQSFANFTWNCPNQTATISLGGTLTTVNGNFALRSSGSGAVTLGSSGTGNLTVGGNFSQTGGTFRFTTSATRTVTVAGDFLLSGGTLDLTASGSSTLNVAGDFSHTAGSTLTETDASSPVANILFNGTGPQTYTSGGTVSGAVNFTVNSGATLLMDGNLLGNGSTGTFTLSSGATLGIGDALGITSSGANGNIRVSGTRTFNTGANYIYNGSVAQHTGNGLPATLNHLTISNTSSGVTLDAGMTVNGTLTLADGVLGTGANTLILGASGSVASAGASSYVNGTVQKVFASTGGGQSFTFPIGNASAYLPVSLTAVNVTHVGNLTVGTTGTDEPNLLTSGIDATSSVNRYWVLTPGGSFAATYDASFNYLASDVDAGANPSAFLVQQYASGAWTPATVSGTPTSTAASISGETSFGDIAIGNAKAGQTITFPSPGNQTYGVAPLTLTASASSGLAVSYTVSSGPAAVAGNLLTITGAGSVTVQATQSGNGYWGAAPPVSQTITVAPKALTVSSGLAAVSRLYNGTLPATITSNNVALAGVIGSDVVSVRTNGYAASFADKNVGTAKVVTVNGLTLTGTSSGNYALTPPVLSANITAASLTVAATGVNKTYDSTVNATVTLSDNRVAGDSLTDAYTTASFATKAVGTGKAVTVTGISISGTDAGNYTLANTTASTTANITAAPLTITANNQNKTYGTTLTLGAGQTAFTATGLQGSETVGAVTLTASGGTGATAAVGTYTLTPSAATGGTFTAGNYAITYANGTLTVVPGAIASYAVSATSPQPAGSAFNVTVTAKDSGGNTVTTDSSTAVTLSSSTGHAQFDANGDGTFGDNTKTLSTGTFTISVRDSVLESVTITATDPNSKTGTSSTIAINPGTIDHYVVSATTPQTAGAAFTVTVTAKDSFNNTVTSDSSTQVTLAGTGSIQFDGNGNGVFGEVNDNRKALSNGTFAIQAKDTAAETVTLTATDGNNKTGTLTGLVIQPLSDNFPFWRTVTINHSKVVGTQTNFPVLISLTDPALAAHAQTNGFDILFTAGDGSTILPYERESYSSATGALVAWVKVPTLNSTTDTVLYLYYGNPNAADQQNRTAAWDTNFKAVWHLDESGNGTAGEYKDSSASANNAQGRGGIPSQADGKIGPGQLCKPSNQEYMESANNIGITGNAVRTLSFWTFVTSSNRMAWVGWGSNISNGEFEAAIRPANVNQTGQGELFLWGYGANDWQTGVSPLANSWHYHSIVHDGTKAHWYLDGTEVLSGFTHTYATYDSHVFIGFEYDVAGQSSVAYLDGYIDEVHVANTNRPLSWIQTEYNNQLDPTLFSTLGPEQTAITTTVASSANPTVYGQPVSFTATVAWAAGTPTGTVQFQTNGVNLGGSVPLVNGSAASLPVSSLPAGHTVVTAIFTDGITPNLSTGTLPGGQVVNPAPLTVTANNASKTYGEAATLSGTAFTGSGLCGGETIGSVTLTSSGAAGTAAVGSYSIVPSAATGGTFRPGNYSITYATTGTLTVSPKGLTVTANNASKTYGQELTFAGTEFTTSGLVNGDTLSSVSLASVGAPARASAGNYAIIPSSASGSGLANYSISYANGTLSVGPKALTVTAQPDTKAYNGTTSSSQTPTATGLVPGDLPNFTQAFDTKDVGTSKTLIPTGSVNDGNGGKNYTVIFNNSTSGAITPAGLTVTGITAADKVYDGTPAATLNLGNAALAGVIGQDIVALDTSGARGAFADKAASNGKTVTISGLTLTGHDAPNYTLTQPSTTANITPAGLTVSGITANNKVYDRSTTATLNGTPTLAGAVQGDSVTLDGTPVASFADKTVANNKPVTVTGFILGGTDAGNYSLVQPAGLKADITPVSLTVNGITANNKPYDGTTAATLNLGGATLNGVLSGDNVSLNTSGAAGNFADPAPGHAKTVYVSGLSLNGLDAANYLLAQPTTTATITAMLDHFALTVNGPLTAGTPFSLIITAQDFSNDTVSDFNGSVDLTTTAGTISPTSSGTFVAGVLTVSGVTVTGAGASKTITATDHAGSGKTGTSAGFTVNPGAVSAANSTLRPATASIQADGISTQVITVQARDLYNNNLTTGGATVVFSKTGGGSLSGTTDHGDGTYTTTLTSSTVIGSATVSATLGGTSVDTWTGTQHYAVISFVAGQAVAALSTLTPATATKPSDGTTTLLLTVQARDIHTNNLASGGSTVEIFKVSGAGTLSATTDNGNGTYTATWTSPITTGTTILGATLDGVAVGTSVSASNCVVTIVPGPVDAAHSTVTAAPASNVTADGISFATITVTVRDAHDNPIPGQTVNLSVAGYSYTISSPAPTDVNGRTTATIKSTSTDTKTITASVGSTTINQRATVGFVAGALNLTKSSVGVSPSNNLLADGVATATITVILEDGNENPIIGQTVTLSVSGTGNTLSTPPVTDANGRTTATLKSTTPETKVITATVGSITLRQNPTVAFVAGLATHLVFSLQPGSTTYGQPLAPQPVVKAKDDLGNDSTVGLGTSKIVTLTLSGGTGALQGTASVDIGTSAGNGVAAFTGLKLSTVGNKQLTASAPGLASAVSTSLTISPLAITVTAVPTSKTYDGTTVSTGIPNISAALASGDISGFTQAYSDKNVGLGNKTLTPSGAVVDGNNGNNYLVTFVPVSTGTISAAPTTTSLSSSLNPVLPSSNLTFTATVTAVGAGNAVATGTVQFQSNGTNNGPPVALAGGQASFTAPARSLGHGSRPITALYASSDGNFVASSSAPLGQVVNVPPVADTQVLATHMSTPLSIAASDLASVEFDPDGDPLTISSVSSVTASNGIVQFQNGTITYTPPGGFSGTDHFTFVVSDPFNGTATSTIDVAVQRSGFTSIIWSVSVHNGVADLVAYGIPGKTYDIQTTTTLHDDQSWQTIGSRTADANSGIVTFTDPNAGNTSRFYRLASQ